jgi:predicted nucleotidyltransferase
VILQKLKSKQLFKECPDWLPDNTHYLVQTGSVAYGVSSNESDIDLLGFTVPRKEDVFPHLQGSIIGFGEPYKPFGTWQEHKIIDPDTSKEYDIVVHSIVKYFDLCMENNPNMIDSLFVPERCISHITTIGQMVRDNRKIFLHKGCWPRFKNYAYRQMHKLETKEAHGKRKELIEKYGYDVKYAYNCPRLLSEVEQMLTEGDLDLQRNREQLKAIRRGEWTKEQLYDYFNDKEKHLEDVYSKSSLPALPDVPKIKSLLVDCLEHHFGSLGNALVIPGRLEETLRKIETLCQKALKG